MKTQAKTFGNLDGLYNVRLIIGDTNSANAIDWTFADVKVAASTPVAAPTSSSPVKKSQIINYEPLPEIKHLFREPEKRPPQFISDAFTLLCIAPMFILFIMVSCLTTLKFSWRYIDRQNHYHIYISGSVLLKN